MLQWHLYGSLTIHIYGICIAMGLLIYIVLTHQNNNFKRLTLDNHFDTLLCLSIASGIIGGRILYCLTHKEEIASFLDIWKITNGGLAISGALIGIIISIFLYLLYYKLSTWKVLDVLALHAPLIHAAGRVGCFFIGCCHGSLWNGPWSVIYHSKESVAILHQAVHPSQLYSVIILISCWILLCYGHKKMRLVPGSLFAFYLILIGFERFMNEFFRYEYAEQPFFFTTHQWISLLLTSLGLLVLLHNTINNYRARNL